MTIDFSKILHKSITEIYLPAGIVLTTLPQIEKEGIDYGAYCLGLNNYKVAFRVAKSTPTKIGFFVTLWTRENSSGKIMPLDFDSIDFVIIYVQNNLYSGQFIFNKKVLLEKGIISHNHQVGKLGFRVYPSWVDTIAKQAKETQKWQLKHFYLYQELMDLKIINKVFKVC